MPTAGPIVAAYDAPIAQGSPTTNFDTFSSWAVEAAGGSNGNRTIVAWDVSVIPVGALVSSATVNGVLSGTTSLVSAAAGVYPITSAAAPVSAQATWNIYKTATNWVAAGGDYDAAAKSAFNRQAGVLGTAFSITATTAVTKALQSYRFGNYIWLLFKADTETAAAESWRPWAQDHATPSNRPTLTVVYSLGSTTMTLTGAGK